MTSYRADPDLPLPEGPSDIPTLGSVSPGLAMASPGGTLPTLSTGRRAAVYDHADVRARTICLDGLEVVSDLSAGIGRVMNRVVAPGLGRGEFVDRDGTTLETTVVAPDLPLVAIQWSGVSTDTRSLKLRVSPSGDGDLRYRMDQGRISVARSATSDHLLCMVLDPPASRWVASSDGSGGVCFRIELSAAQRPTLLVTRCAGENAAGAWKAATHLIAHERRAGEAPAGGGLVVSSGIPEIDEGMAWLRARIAATKGGSVEEPAALLITGVGALATGEQDTVSVLLERLESLRLDGDPTAWAAAGVLAGRLALATGRTDDALSWATADPAVDRASAPADLELYRVACTTLAEGLHRGAPEAVIRALRDAATPGPDSGAPGGPARSRRLPTINASSGSSTPAAWVSRALTGDPPPEPPPLGDGVADDTVPSAFRERAMAAWGAFGHDPLDAWTTWRQVLSAGLAGGPAGPGTWDTWLPEGGGSAPVAGIMAATWVHGLLGVSADAPAGRLRIAPRLPGHLTDLRVGGIAVGSTRASLTYRRDGAVHRFTLDPTLARVPPLVLFEPTVPGEVASVSIDGATAELEMTPHAGGTRVSVQIPLDSSRVIEIEPR